MTHLVWPAQPGAILKITEIDDTTGQVVGHYADALAWCGVSDEYTCATPGQPCDWHQHRHVVRQTNEWARAVLATKQEAAE